MFDSYIATAIINVIALLFLSVFIHGNCILASHRKMPFFFGIGLAILVILSEVGTILFANGHADQRIIHIFFNVLGFSLAPLIPIALIAIFDMEILKKHVGLFLPALLNILAAILSPVYGLYFFVDVRNHYERGNLFWVFVLIYITNLFLLLFRTLNIGRTFFYPIKWKIVSLSLFTVAGTFVQLFIPVVYSSWHCVTLSLILFYILLSEFDSSFDTLTGHYNRAAFDKAAKRFKERESFTIIVMDINNFKEVNDTYGHDYGDVVLKKVATIIRSSFDHKCICYRIGGDEFYILCRDANPEKLKHQLKTMTDKLSKERQNDCCLPTIAYGYEHYSGDEELDFQKLLNTADDQMYQFKKIQKTNTMADPVI